MPIFSLSGFLHLGDDLVHKEGFLEVPVQVGHWGAADLMRKRSAPRVQPTPAPLPAPPNAPLQSASTCDSAAFANTPVLEPAMFYGKECSAQSSSISAPAMDTLGDHDVCDAAPGSASPSLPHSSPSPCVQSPLAHSIQHSTSTSLVKEPDSIPQTPTTPSTPNCAVESPELPGLDGPQEMQDLGKGGLVKEEVVNQNQKETESGSIREPPEGQQLPAPAGCEVKREPTDETKRPASPLISSTPHPTTVADMLDFSTLQSISYIRDDFYEKVALFAHSPLLLHSTAVHISN